MNGKCWHCGSSEHDTATCAKEMSRKDTNPKDAVGMGKAPISTVSAAVMSEVGLAMLEGARKYGRHNYRVAGVRASVYYDAVFRHLSAWWEGEDTDADSGLSHVTKAIAGLMVLRDSMLQGNWIDDRPPPSPKGWRAAHDAKAAEIVLKYPTPKEAFTATDTPADTDRKLGKDKDRPGQCITLQADTYVPANPETGERARIVATLDAPYHACPHGRAIGNPCPHCKAGWARR